MSDNLYTGETAKLLVDGKEYEFPIMMGTEGERAIDIRSLRSETGYITFDHGLANTGSTASAITFLDGEKGILRYRGYAIEDLAENCTFVEVAHLLLHGKLPNRVELQHFSDLLNSLSLLHEDMRQFFSHYPITAHPMAILSSMATMLSSFHPMEKDYDADESHIELAAARILSKIRTIAAFSYKQVVGDPIVYPSWKRSYCENFLNMMFSTPVNNYTPSAIAVKALNQLLVLHADHEQNCSTSAVRLVGSAMTDFYASMGAGVAALWGPLHGGANQMVIEMLEMIRKDGCDYKKYINKAKDKNDPFRLMGFGHRVYKNYDPRARIIKKTADDFLDSLNISDPLLDIARNLEEIALKDDYFIQRNLYPNVDFYSGIIYRAMGIPLNMFTVMFAIGRMPGWISHWWESRRNSSFKIWRPRQLFIGETKRDFVPMDQRK